MATALNQFEMGELMQEQERIARLEERTEQLQSDIIEIKTDIRRIDGKVDAVKDAVNELRLEMRAGFAAVEMKFASLSVGRALDKVWWLTIAAALLGVMARGFHWI